MSDNPSVENVQTSPENLNQNDFDLIKKEIDDLANGDEELKFDGKLTSEFIGKLSEDNAKQLLDSINKVKEAMDSTSTPVPEEIKNLEKVLLPIVNPLNKISDWNLGDVKATSPEETPGKFIGKDVESQVQTILTSLEERLNSFDDVNDERIVKIKNMLIQLQTVLHNPSKENTNLLQKFIYSTLGNEEDKKDFEKKNSKTSDGNFDGKFGPNTLKRVQKGLEEIETYAQQIKDSINAKTGLESNDGGADAITLDKVVEKLGLQKKDDLNRENLGLPKEGDIYTKEGDNGYYFVEGDYLVYMPLGSDGKINLNGKRLKISDYKEGDDSVRQEYQLTNPDGGNAGGSEDAPDGVDANPEANNGTVQIPDIITSSGFQNIGGDIKTRLGIPESQNLYMIPNDLRYYYYVRSDQNSNQSLIRVTNNYFDGYSVLDTSKYKQGMKLNDGNEGIRQKERFNSYPPLTEENRVYLEGLLQSSIRGNKLLNKSPNKVVIKNNKFKVDSFDYINGVVESTFTNGWIFDASKDPDQLGKDMEMVSLSNYLMTYYKGKINGGQFYLKDGEELRLRDKNNNEKVIIKKRDWVDNYGKLPDDKAFTFTNYVNKWAGGVYFEEPQPATSTASGEISQDIPFNGEILGVPDVINYTQISHRNFAPSIGRVGKEEEYSQLLARTYNLAKGKTDTSNRTDMYLLKFFADGMINLGVTPDLNMQEEMQDYKIAMMKAGLGLYSPGITEKIITQNGWHMSTEIENMINAEGEKLSEIDRETFEAFVKHFGLEDNEELKAQWNDILKAIRDNELKPVTSVNVENLLESKETRQTKAKELCDELKGKGNFTGEDLLNFDLRVGTIVDTYVNDSANIISYDKFKNDVIHVYNEFIINNLVKGGNINVDLIPEETPNTIDYLKIDNMLFSTELNGSVVVEFSQLLAKSYNLAKKNFNGDENKDLFNYFVNGLSAKNDNKLRRYCIMKLQDALAVQATGVFSSETYEAFLKHFQLEDNDDIKNDYDKIRAFTDKDFRREKAVEFRNGLRDELVTKQDWMKFDTDTGLIVENYVNNPKNFVSYFSFTSQIRDIYDKMDKHYTWGSNPEYTFVGKELKNRKPYGKGKVEYRDEEGNLMSYDGEWDNKGRLISCTSYGNKIDIDYPFNDGSPLLSMNGVYTGLAIDSDGIDHIGKIADSINNMTAVLKAKQKEGFEFKRTDLWFGNLRVFGTVVENGGYGASYTNNTNLTLVKDIKETFHLNGMSSTQITNGFDLYFKKVLGTNLRYS